ncbi:hypothetical protein [Rhodococcus sp. H29-C3]|uniref:hypothetical protein n=1 Tax=Rhodococcus sp. H29-C3 TaxID=3046307 RepID=UPI0024B8B69C|nr:hypothetical protein [Rhodococcus sp. H29-C3]MDJ0363010.1 hypothetical protein [Rhodococcus sp. H29-C3]
MLPIQAIAIGRTLCGGTGRLQRADRRLQPFGEAATRVPTRSIPNFVVRATALFDHKFRTVAADLGHIKRVSDDRMRRILGVSPRRPEDAIIASAESMIRKSLAGR